MSQPASRLRGLHVLADDDARWKWDPVEQARAACAGGAGVVQLRAKHAGDRQVLLWAREIRSLTRRAGALFFVNDRFDLALLCDADGVHLGQEDLPPARLPASARRRLRVGRSTHDAHQARAACGEGVAYLAFGPVFGTRTKDTGYDARGLPALREVAAIAGRLPVIAIGGIDRERAVSALAAGAAGLAVISAVAGADDPEARVRELCALFPVPGGGRA